MIIEEGCIYYDRANWHSIGLILFYLILKGWDA